MFYLNLLGADSHFWKELGVVGCPFVVQSSLMTSIQNASSGCPVTPLGPILADRRPQLLPGTAH